MEVWGLGFGVRGGGKGGWEGRGCLTRARASAHSSRAHMCTHTRARARRSTHTHTHTPHRPSHPPGWLRHGCGVRQIPLVLVCADAHQLAQRFVLAPADADAGARADAEAGTPDAPEPGKTAAAPPSPEQQPSPELPGAEAAAAAAAPSFSGPPGPSPTSAAAVEEHSAGDAGGLLPPLQQPEQPEQTQPHSPGVAAAAAGSLERLPDLHPRPRGPPGAAAAAPSTTSSSSSGGGGPFGPSLEHLPDAELQRTLLARDRLYEAVRCGRPRLLVLCSWAQPADWVFVLVRGYAKLLAGIGDVCPNR